MVCLPANSECDYSFHVLFAWCLCMTSVSDALRTLGQSFCDVYRPSSIILARGQGARVWDVDGRDYIDFAAGVAVCGLGHSDPDLIRALTEQADQLWHVSNLFYTEPPLQLARELIAASRFGQRLFFCNSGAEANEVAIKTVRKWAAQQGRSADHRVIVTCTGSFHGRSLATVTATAQPKYQQGFEPLPPGFSYVPFNDSAALEAVMALGHVAAVMLEPIQGEGGVMATKPGYLAQVRALCDRYQALLVLDEVQCGLGRTGALFAHWHDGIVPDIVTLAKGLGGGFPIGAALFGPAVAQTLQRGDHGSTFGGNPLAAAVARCALSKLASSAVQANVERQSVALWRELETLQHRYRVFSTVRGRGLLLGAVLAPPYAGQVGRLIDHAVDTGVLVLQAGPDVLRLTPPLTLTDEERMEGMERLEMAIQAFCAAHRPNQGA